MFKLIFLMFVSCNPRVYHSKSGTLNELEQVSSDISTLTRVISDEENEAIINTAESTFWGNARSYFEPFAIAANLKTGEIIGLKLYGGDGYQLYNDYTIGSEHVSPLWGMLTERQAELFFLGTVSAVNRLPNCDAGTDVWHGTNLKSEDAQFVVGALKVNPSFLSTSEDRKIALDFALNGGNIPYLFHIKCNRGKPISRYVAFFGEKEILYQARFPFRVLAINSEILPNNKREIFNIELEEVVQ